MRQIIVLEGVNGAGKTSVMDRLAEFFSHENTNFCIPESFCNAPRPDRKFAYDCDPVRVLKCATYLKDLVWNHLFVPILYPEDEKVIIVDRYLMSFMVCSQVLDGIEFEEVSELAKYIQGSIEMALTDEGWDYDTYYLNCEPKTIRKRLKKRDGLNVKKKLVKQLIDTFDEEASRPSTMYGNVHNYDGEDSTDNICASILRSINYPKDRIKKFFANH